jgi:hypothetical protein
MDNLPELEPTNELRIPAGHGKPMAVAIAREGRVVFGVGERSSLWIWAR